MSDQALYREEPSAPSSPITSELQSGPVEVAEGVQGEVGGEPQGHQLQGRQGVLDHTGVKPREPLTAGHMTRVVEFIIRQIEGVLPP